ncbi:MAG: hypothetical protein E2O37_02100 [Proteobacteria bacterium]|nr:MAG: hypothetical protein E2O37_02100 [Pseudomonadota bacterium]TDJ67955.1 MAG: hypothetical protein E2O38_16785 [Pseudomonadota bacterium]
MQAQAPDLLVTVGRRSIASIGESRGFIKVLCLLLIKYGACALGSKYNVAVVGARRKRQGTGKYVAREFANGGCDACAIVGTTPDTVATARHNLQERYGIRREGYLSLSTLLANTPVDIVAICSPAEVHLHHLEVAVEAGCHVFCEKPMWWSTELAIDSGARAEIRQRAAALVDRYTQKGRFLALNTQWPFTLPGVPRIPSWGP